MDHDVLRKTSTRGNNESGTTNNSDDNVKETLNDHRTMCFLVFTIFFFFFFKLYLKLFIFSIGLDRFFHKAEAREQKEMRSVGWLAK